jgi:hypothetical protein
MPPAPDGTHPEEVGMFVYRVYSADGDELGEPTYAQRI